MTRWPEIRRLCGALPPEIRDAEELRSSIRDAEELRSSIRANDYSIPNVVGTCSMGPSPDDDAVVDATGHVCGTERLCVVDASIMPDVPSGFTQVPTIMIAECLSEEIAARL